MIRHLWSRHRWLLIAFVAAVALTGFFGVRALLFTLHWSSPASRDQAIAGWMTPRYVALSWHVPPEVVAEALDLTRDGSGRRITLDKLAAERGVDPAALADAVLAAIKTYRSEQ